ncbi:MAG: ATP-binding protein [Methanobacteriaceae archaeon]|jgi:predicted AAA+ superfamily ATPase|nr:ATP-binding protein [Methanobacteriaceae archaeon]
MVLEKEFLVDFVLAKIRNAPKLSEDQITVDGKQLDCRDGYHRIEGYVDEFLNGYEDDRFIIMPGLRGLGKTTILLQIYDYLINEKKIKQNRVLYLSVDELRAYFGGRLIDVIDVFVNEIHGTSLVDLDEEVFILIDESHYDKNWSLVGKIVYDNSRKIFTIFTGSSALNLEINADSARRARKEAIYPLNFSEYLTLKHDIQPPEKATGFLMDLIFKGDTDSIRKMVEIENELLKKSTKLSKSLKKEWENYLCCGGFPFGLNLDDVKLYEGIFDMVEKVIQKDVFVLQSFKTETSSTILNIILFLALQKSGTTSQAKLAKSLSVSSSSVKTILDVLEKTHLIFSILPYGSAGKLVRKSWKYYFLSPSIKAAINFKFGKYAPPSNREFLGVLAENLVVAQFFKMKETMHLPRGIFYDPQKGGVDFLLQNIDGQVIPVEVVVGDKHPKQVKRAIDRYKSKYGVLISNATRKVTKKGDVVHIPLTTFSLL